MTEPSSSRIPSGVNAVSKLPELRMLAAISAGLLVVLFLVFYQESVGQVFRLWVTLLWLFAIPGYALLYWAPLRFAAKLVFGIGLQLALLVILSYGLSGIGLHLKFHGILLPLLSIGIGLALHRAPRLRACSLLRNF